VIRSTYAINICVCELVLVAVCFWSRYLGLSRNQLTGCIPESISALSVLGYVTAARGIMIVYW
jgi:hypothetical protein